MAEKKLVIIDVDALLGVRQTLSYPQCSLAQCNKGENFLGADHSCLRKKWCTSASYDPRSILEYRSESNITPDNCYAAVLPALEKLDEANWLVSFWTTRPQKQTFHIIKTFREKGIWARAQRLAGTPLLLNSSELPDNGEFSPATVKLALFERVYGKLLDAGWRLAAIEADPLEAKILEGYLGSRLLVHSTRIWVELLVVERERVNTLLGPGSSDSSVIFTNRAS